MNQFLLIFGVHVFIALVASVLVAVDKVSPPQTKTYQWMLSLLLSFAGPVIVIIMALYHRAKPSPAPENPIGYSFDKHLEKYPSSWKV